MSAMKTSFTRLALAAGLGAAVAAGGVVAAPSAEEPKMGGVLRIVVGSKIPSYDGHRESTFGHDPSDPAVLQPADPHQPGKSAVDDGLSSATFAKATFRRRQTKARPTPSRSGRGVKFHDGTPLTAHDIVATYNKIVFPPEGVLSSRVSFFAGHREGFGAG